MTDETARAIRDTWIAEAPALVARLVRITRDVGRAEELAQDALVAALEHWPARGIPANPAAWLVTVAKHRALNAVNHARLADRKHDQLVHELPTTTMIDDEALDDDIGDELLKLVFIACHPVLAPESRVALVLRMLGGLTTGEIARAFLVAEPTIAQRIVRAKRALSEAAVPFEIPRGEDRTARLASVLEVIYLVFNEGYAASSGDDLIRADLATTALRLGHRLASLVDDPEVHGLLALMELNASRLAARVDGEGRQVLLLDQDRARWDDDAIGRGLASLAKAGRGYYALQAAISACHARAKSAADTKWAQIAALYGELARLRPSPVIELNRAIAVAMADGPDAGLEILDAIARDPVLARYHLLPAARADLLAKLGRIDDARAELERAAQLTDNAQTREELRRRARELAS